MEPLTPELSEAPAIEAAEMVAAVHERGNGRVAVLLAVAAVTAAIIGARASMVSNGANDKWQSSLRTSEKRSAAVMNDTQTVYQWELPMAVRILQARIVAAQLETAAATASPGVAKALTLEGSVQRQLADSLSKVDLAGKPDYELQSGGFDLGKRMADVRAANKDLASLDPDAIEAEGDKLASKAVMLTYGLLPTSLGALFGVLAQPLRRYRRGLLIAGSAAVLLGMAIAAGVEVLA